VTPARKAPLAEASAADFKTTKRETARPLPGAFDDIPTAAVVATPKLPAAAKAAKAAPPAPRSVESPLPASPVAAQLQKLLANPNSLAVAVALQEVLGPPKCKRG
jgi:hypothetical protein